MSLITSSLTGLYLESRVGGGSWPSDSLTKWINNLLCKTLRERMEGKARYIYIQTRCAAYRKNPDSSLHPAMLNWCFCRIRLEHSGTMRAVHSRWRPVLEKKRKVHYSFEIGIHFLPACLLLQPKIILPVYCLLTSDATVIRRDTAHKHPSFLASHFTSSTLQTLEMSYNQLY